MPSSKNKTFERKDVPDSAADPSRKSFRRKVKSTAYTPESTTELTAEYTPDGKESGLKLKSRNKRDRLSKQSGRSDSVSESESSSNLGDKASVRHSIKFEARDDLDEWSSEEEESLPMSSKKKAGKGKRKSSKPGGPSSGSPRNTTGSPRNSHGASGHTREKSVSEISDEIDGFIENM
jgi:hypothetical protein